MPFMSATLVIGTLLSMPMPGNGTVYRIVMPWSFRRFSTYGRVTFHSFATWS